MKGQWSGGKGSGRRKTANDKDYRDNWDLIFNKSKKDKKDESNTQIQERSTKR